MIEVAIEPCLSGHQGNHEDAEYDAFLRRLQARFLANTAGDAALFKTDAADLWERYLSTFGPAPADGEPASALRQYHACHTCRHFVERFGGLVTIGVDGQTKPAFWDVDDAPDEYKLAIAGMAKTVARANVTGVFLSSDATYSAHETGIWHHLALTPTASMIFRGGALAAGKAIAAKGGDFKTVSRALGEFSRPHVEMALKLLQSDAIYRSEKVLGQAEWLRNLHVARDAALGSGRRKNVVWRAIAKAPAGFCHPRSSMIGTLLEDIEAGMEFSEVSRRFAAKMAPTQYQRPQAAPTAGAIEAAEKLIAQLGAAGSLARRYARLDEVQALWKPAQVKDGAPTGGVFACVKAKGSAPPPTMAIPAQTMTWAKFAAEVLPTAEKIDLRAPAIGPYTAFVTAVNADAPPILQWDNDSARNPVSWYLYSHRASAVQFGLIANAWVKVNAVCLKPSMWNGGMEHQGVGIVLILDAAKDTYNPGAVLFPEILKAEFHGARSVIEAYSREKRLEGAGDQSASGYMLSKGQAWGVVVRVSSGSSVCEYKLDRWD